MAGSIFKKIISYLIIASIFISGNGIVEIGFTVYWYYLLYIPFALFCCLTYHKINKHVVWVLLTLMAYSLVTYQYGLHLVFKQIIGISFTAFVFYNYLLFENFDIGEIIRKYVVFSKTVLVIGFIQVFLFAIAISCDAAGDVYLFVFQFLKGSNISYRFQSVTQEPSYLAYAFAPVVFLSLHNLLEKSSYLISRRWSVLFILGYLLTFSVVAFIGLLMMVFFIAIKNPSLNKLTLKYFGFVLVISLCYLFYTVIPIIRTKVDDTLTQISQDIFKENRYRAMNYSTYAFLSNLRVTKDSFKEHPLTGTGLGTYELTYDKFLPEELKNYSQLNRRDANSMGLRLISETGLIGFSFFLFFLIRFRIKSKMINSSRQDFMWIVNTGILIMILLILVRNGDYIFLARVLFLLMYYFTYKEAKNAENNNSFSNSLA